MSPTGRQSALVSIHLWLVFHHKSVHQNRGDEIKETCLLYCIYTVQYVNTSIIRCKEILFLENIFKSSLTSLVWYKHRMVYLHFILPWFLTYTGMESSCVCRMYTGEHLLLSFQCLCWANFFVKMEMNSQMNIHATASCNALKLRSATSVDQAFPPFPFTLSSSTLQ